MSNDQLDNLKELVATNLVDWTLSAKVQEVLGLSSVDEALFKKELAALEEQGIIERDGVRRGLKFRASFAALSGKPDKPEKVSKKKEVPVVDNSIESKPKKEKKEKKAKAVPELSVKDIPCEISILPRHEYMSDVTNVAISKLFEFMLRGSADTGRSISFRKMNRGIQVKTYNEAYILSDVIYSKENFKKLLKISGIISESVDEQE